MDYEPAQSGATHGLRAGQDLQLVREEGGKVDLMESSKPGRTYYSCVFNQHGFIEAAVVG